MIGHGPDGVLTRRREAAPVRVAQESTRDGSSSCVPMRSRRAALAQPLPAASPGDPALGVTRREVPGACWGSALCAGVRLQGETRRMTRRPFSSQERALGLYRSLTHPEPRASRGPRPGGSSSPGLARALSPVPERRLRVLRRRAQRYLDRGEPSGHVLEAIAPAASPLWALLTPLCRRSYLGWKLCSWSGQVPGATVAWHAIAVASVRPWGCHP